jgi:hypothetical protein
MKKLIVSTVVALLFVVLLNGCIAIGTGPKASILTPRWANSRLI